MKYLFTYWQQIIANNRFSFKRVTFKLTLVTHETTTFSKAQVYEQGTKPHLGRSSMSMTERSPSHSFPLVHLLLIRLSSSFFHVPYIFRLFFFDRKCQIASPILVIQGRLLFIMLGEKFLKIQNQRHQFNEDSLLCKAKEMGTKMVSD